MGFLLEIKIFSHIYFLFCTKIFSKLRFQKNNLKKLNHGFIRYSQQQYSQLQQKFR